MQSVDTWQQLGQITRRNDVLYEALVVLVTQGKLREAHAMLQSIDTKTMSVGDI